MFSEICFEWKRWWTIWAPVCLDPVVQVYVLSFLAMPFPQTGQVYRYFFKWQMFTCSCRPDLDENVASQNSHSWILRTATAWDVKVRFSWHFLLLLSGSTSGFTAARLQAEVVMTPLLPSLGWWLSSETELWAKLKQPAASMAAVSVFSSLG